MRIDEAGLGLARLLVLFAGLIWSSPGYAGEARRVEDAEPQLAQFQLPPAAPTTPGAPGAATPPPPPPLAGQLTYSYILGSESEVSYRRNQDLDNRLRDDFSLLTPQVNAAVIYRPLDWLETKVALIADREMLIHGDRRVNLPNGDVLVRPNDRNSFLVDEAWVTLHRVTDPFSFTVGRRNYEDERHWLYDTSLDVGVVGFRQGRFRSEFSFGREVIVNLDAFQNQQKDRVNTYMLYSDYRAFEDIRVAAYTIRRDDKANLDGRAQHYGLRSQGFPTESLSYWTEGALLRGKDETSQSIEGWGFDVGATYRFIGAPLNPNITLAYAVGSGDSRPDDRKNNQFRQTGLQSNEQKFAGLSEFKYYGEALDPELSNLRIITLGLGFRPIRDTSVDFVFHWYRLHGMAETLRSSALTAEMNQNSDQMSYDVGRELDIVIGFRNVLGLPKLGIDLRAGRFFPGKAFSNDRDTHFEEPDIATAFVVKFWW